MPRFCNQCGRPLQSGEVCQCSNPGYGQQNQGYGQQPNPRYGQQPDPRYGQQIDPRYIQPDPRYVQPDPRYGQPDPRYAQQGYNNTSNGGGKAQEFFNGLKGFLKGTLSFCKSPMEVLDYYYKENKIWSGIYMFTSYIVMVLIFLIIMSMRISMEIHSMIRERFGNIDLSAIRNYMPEIPYFSIILLAIVLMVVYYFAMSGVVLGLSKIFSKVESSFAKAMVVVCGKQWYMTLFLIVASVLALIHPKGGMYGVLVGIAVSSIFEMVSFCELIKMKSSNKLYALIIYNIIKTILLSLLLGLYIYFIGSEVESILRNSIF